MLKLKLQYFGHLMWRAASFEKTMILGKLEGRRRRGQQRKRWLDGITSSEDRGTWRATVHGVTKSQTNWACRQTYKKEDNALRVSHRDHRWPIGYYNQKLDPVTSCLRVIIVIDLLVKTSSNTLATWCKELTHWKRPWSWEKFKAGEEGDAREWDGWMASPTWWT